MDALHVEIKARSMSGETLATLRLPDTATVLDAKKSIARKLDLQRHRMRLLLDMEAPDDTSLLRCLIAPLDFTLVQVGYVTDVRQSERLCDAAERGDLQEVDTMLNIPLSPNFECPFKRELSLALQFAADGGHTPVVRLLCEARASVNEGDPRPLYLASEKGHLEVARTLCDFGANKNDCGVLEITAVAVAAASKKHDVVQFLCAEGADLHTPLQISHQPLFLSLQNKNYDSAAHIQKAGAEPLPIQILCTLLCDTTLCRFCLILMLLTIPALDPTGDTQVGFLESACGVFVGSVALMSVHEFIFASVQVDRLYSLACVFAITGPLAGIAITITVTFELAAFRELLRYWSLSEQSSTVMMLLFSMPTSVPIVAAFCTALLGLLLIVDLLFNTSDGQYRLWGKEVPCPRCKAFWGAWMVPLSIFLGWYGSLELQSWLQPWTSTVRTGSRLCSIVIFVCFLRLSVKSGRADLMCQPKIVPHLLASCSRCCCRRACEADVLTEPLI